MTVHYTMFIGNDAAGGDTNLAALNFYNGRSWGSDLSDDVANLIAFAQYLLPAEDTYIRSIAAGPATGSGQFDQAFPTAVYATLVAADVNLMAMTAWATRYGYNALTALGIGAVMTKHTALTGRSGRGRLTTPWLPVSHVNANGALLTGSDAIVTDGWDRYMSTPLGFNDLLKSAAGYTTIDTVSCSTRLGHQRSRTQ
jgi:hypothetical protein